MSFAATNLWVASERVLCVLTDLRYFCFKLGETAAETHEMLRTVFGDNGMKQRQTFE
jgi:hypothetical protein